jgi:hypothetical protein
MAFNEGLPSRFPCLFNFPDYSDQELHSILMGEGRREGGGGGGGSTAAALHHCHLLALLHLGWLMTNGVQLQNVATHPYQENELISSNSSQDIHLVPAPHTLFLTLVLHLSLLHTQGLYIWLVCHSVKSWVAGKNVAPLLLPFRALGIWQARIQAGGAPSRSHCRPPSWTSTSPPRLRQCPCRPEPTGNHHHPPVRQGFARAPCWYEPRHLVAAA